MKLNLGDTGVLIRFSLCTYLLARCCYAALDGLLGFACVWNELSIQMALALFHSLATTQMPCKRYQKQLLSKV